MGGVSDENHAALAPHRHPGHVLHRPDDDQICRAGPRDESGGRGAVRVKLPGQRRQPFLWCGPAYLGRGHWLGVREVHEPDRRGAEYLVTEERSLTEAHQHLAVRGRQPGRIHPGPEADEARVARFRCIGGDQRPHGRADTVRTDQDVGGGLGPVGEVRGHALRGLGHLGQPLPVLNPDVPLPRRCL
jgi:hypothetical protein